MKKNYTLVLLLLLSSNLFRAQTTETFETETGETTSFTDNSQVFNITTQLNGPFNINASFPGTGWSGTANDNRYIDNDNVGGATPGTGTGFTISSNGGAPFKINSFYIFLSGPSLNLSLSGTLTVVGKLAGSTVFTASGTSHNTNSGVNNGFTFIDMATFGGSNNTGVNIDQLVLTTTSNWSYVAFDAMKWSVGTSLSNEEFVKDRDLFVTPNPANDLLNIDSSVSGDFEICNILGQVVKTFSIVEGDNPVTVSELNDGIYFVKSKNNLTKVKKIIIKH